MIVRIKSLPLAFSTDWYIITSLSKITIVTPSYNQGHFLEETIRSVIDQDYPNLEYMIFDGGSTDNSVEIIKKYEKYIDYWVSENDGGQSHAINKGFEKASGDLIGWINSDDMLEANSLEKVAAFFQRNLDHNVVIGETRVIGERGGFLYDIFPPKNIEQSLSTISGWFDEYIPQPSTFWRRSLLEEVGLLDENKYIALDYDLWQRFAKVATFGVMKERLAYLRIHDDAKCPSSTDRVIRETIDTFFEYHELTQAHMDDLKEVCCTYATKLNQSERKRRTLEQSLSFRIGHIVSVPFRLLCNIFNDQK